MTQNYKMSTYIKKSFENLLQLVILMMISDSEILSNEYKTI